jgi:molybdenum-dependent DNA-binding transcriptional regulator ModE
MREIDHSRLDGHLLRMLVAVVETGGITAAAQRLGVTQSAVSHLLDKLRAITGDPLFVKSGRGVVATARAEQLAADARELLLALERFRHLGRLRSCAVGGHLHDRRERLPARRAAAAPDAAPAAGGTWRGAAGDPLGGARAGHAAPPPLRPDHHPPPARRCRHHAKAPVRGRVPRVLRPGMPHGPAHPGRLSGSRTHYRGVRAGTRAGPGPVDGRPGHRSDAFA